VAEEGLLRFDLDKNGKIEYHEFFDFISFIVSEKGYTL
jgi:Ca2+-binding EF-hand superfamily protein